MGLSNGVNNMDGFLISILICLILFPIGIYFIQKYSLNYYKLNGRLPIEIECWLKTRHWYSKFTDNIKNEILESYRDENSVVKLTNDIMDEIDKKIKDITSGFNDKETISSAFCWNTSLEGTEYWAKKEYEFLKWYYGQYIDFHLFK